MPTLNWIGKDKVVNHHLDVPFYTLEHQYGFRGDNPDDKSETHSGNMIIHGDNLIALKALLPEFEGRINCAYFDPPYNTGEEKWVYPSPPLELCSLATEGTQEGECRGIGGATIPLPSARALLACYRRDARRGKATGRRVSGNGVGGGV